MSITVFVCYYLFLVLMIIVSHTAFIILPYCKSKKFQLPTNLKVVDNNDDTEDGRSNPVANTMKTLYEKVFFYGLDNSLNLQDKDRSKVNRISSTLYQNEKPNPFFTKSEQIASALIKEKASSKEKNKHRSTNTKEEQSTQLDIDNSLTMLRQRLLSLENQIKVIEITELSLIEDTVRSDNDEETEELLTEKKLLQSEINNIKADIITQLAMIEN